MKTTKTNIVEDLGKTISILIKKFNLLERNEKVCYGVTIPQSCTLDALLRLGKPSMKELSREIGVAVSTMTRILNVLVRDGYVKRENNNKDRRIVFVDLTVKGKKLAHKLNDCQESYLATVLNRIPENKQAIVHESLTLIMSTFEQEDC